MLANRTPGYPFIWAHSNQAITKDCQTVQQMEEMPREPSLFTASGKRSVNQGPAGTGVRAPAGQQVVQVGAQVRRTRPELARKPVWPSSTTGYWRVGGRHLADL